MALDRTKVLEAAQKHLAKGHYERAIGEYQKLVASDPNDVRTWLKIGDLHTRQGNHDKAVETYGRVADQYTQQGFFRKAVAVYKQILKLDPERLDVLLSLGDMYEQLQLSSDALMTFENVANEYLKRGDTDAALDTLARMVALDSGNIPIRIKYAEALSKAGRTEEAADSFEVGANLLADLGRYDDYIKVAERLLYHRPDDHQLAAKLAHLYLERNDPKRALSKLQICFQADPSNISTLHLLAKSFEALGQIPKTVSVYKEIARLHQQAGNLEDRAVILKEILELDPGDTETRRALASYAPPSTTHAVAPSAPPPGAIQHPSAVPIPESPDDDGDFELIEDDDSAIFLTDDDAMELTEDGDELQELPSAEFETVAEPSGLLILEDDEEDEETGKRSVLPRQEAPAAFEQTNLEEAHLEALPEIPDPFAPEVPPAPAAGIDRIAPPIEAPAAAPGPETGEFLQSEDTGSMLEILVDEVQTGSVPSISLGAESPDLEEQGPSTSDIPSIPPDVAREAQIARLLTECDVFERYGLQAKVIQQLGRVLEIEPSHVEARERLKDAYIESGNDEQAVFHLYELATMFQEERPKVAILYFRQVLELDPSSEPARSVVAAYRSELPPAGYVPVLPEEETSPVDLARQSEGPTAPAQNLADFQVPGLLESRSDADGKPPPPAGVAGLHRRRTSTNLVWPSRAAPPPPDAPSSLDSEYDEAAAADPAAFGVAGGGAANLHDEGIGEVADEHVITQTRGAALAPEEAPIQRPPAADAPVPSTEELIHGDSQMPTTELEPPPPDLAGGARLEAPIEAPSPLEELQVVPPTSQDAGDEAADEQAQGAPAEDDAASGKDSGAEAAPGVWKPPPPAAVFSQRKSQQPKARGAAPAARGQGLKGLSPRARAAIGQPATSKTDARTSPRRTGTISGTGAEQTPAPIQGKPAAPASIPSPPPGTKPLGIPRIGERAVPPKPAATLGQPPAGTTADASSGPEPKPSEPQRPPLSALEVEEIIGEADFFAEQDLLEEARTTLQDALRKHEDQPEFLARLGELAELAAAQEIASAPPMSGEDEAFRLAEKLAEELDEDSSPTDAGAEMIDVETVFAQFKRGVKEQIGPQDSDTHFDLGIAYKEMGLLDDAIEEFQLAQNNPKKECISLTMIGLCHIEKGTLHEATESFKKGLYAKEMSPREELGLYFELGIAYELLRDPEEALYYFEKVQKRDASFRGVEAKIEELQALVAAKKPEAPAPVEPTSMRPPARKDEVDRELDELLGKD